MKQRGGIVLVMIGLAVVLVGTLAFAVTSEDSDEAVAGESTSSGESEMVEKFVEDFATALQNGDRDFVLERLHP